MTRPGKVDGGEGWSLVRACPRCGRDPARCACAKAPKPAEKPTIRLRMEKRRGKPVTVLALSGIDEGAAAALLKEAKALCGAGGTLKEGDLEVQGEHRDRLRPLLAERGYVVKG